MENLNPLVSVVLPAFKAQFFKKAIESILNQTYTNFELIIVNDCSPEDLNSIVSLFDDERIQYHINKENIGGRSLVENWNLCLSYASGEYFILASDDDLYEPEFIEELISLAIKYPDVDLFHSRISIIDNDDKITSISSACLEYETCLDFMNQRVINRRLQVAPDFMTRTSALREIGGFVEFPLAWYSDEATWYAIAQKNGVAYSDKVLFNWRSSGVNISSKTDNTSKKLEAANLYKLWMLNFLNSFGSLQSKNDIFFKNNIMKFLEVAVNRQIVFDLSDSKFSVFFSIITSKKHFAIVPISVAFRAFLAKGIKFFKN